MKILKKIVLAIAVLLVLAQFVRPPRHTSDVSGKDIVTKIAIPPEVLSLLRTSCYDCHSNATKYPWYAEIQPVGWWLNSHIQEARRDLNFSEFAGYRLKRQVFKLQQISDQVADEEMPLPSYLIMHSEARLTKGQRDMIVAWATAARDSLKSAYPDSLR